MANIFFISDHHLFHRNILKFTGYDGVKIRPKWQCGADNHPQSCNCIHEMHEYMVDRWNSVVRDEDKVYHLGDVTFDYGRDFSCLMSRLRGHKRLIFGNHDRVKGTDLLRHFDKFQVWRLFKDEKFICSHVPITEGSFRHNAKVNVHGHIHQNNSEPGPYFNVCVEKLDYTPMAMEDLCVAIRDKM